MVGPTYSEKWVMKDWGIEFFFVFFLNKIFPSELSKIKISPKLKTELFFVFLSWRDTNLPRSP